MQIIAFFSLIFTFFNANAMGDPSIIYFFCSEIFILFCLKIWVIFCSKPWGAKALALAALATGLFLIIGLTFVPNYVDRRQLVDTLSIVGFLLSVGLAFYFMRFK